MPIPALSLGDDEDDEENEDDDGPGATEIQLGGLNTTDKRFRAYKGYTGCLSSKSPLTLLNLFADFHLLNYSSFLSVIYK